MSCTGFVLVYGHKIVHQDSWIVRYFVCDEQATHYVNIRFKQLFQSTPAHKVLAGVFLQTWELLGQRTTILN